MEMPAFGSLVKSITDGESAAVCSGTMWEVERSEGGGLTHGWSSSFSS